MHLHYNTFTIWLLWSVHMRTLANFDQFTSVHHRGTLCTVCMNNTFSWPGQSVSHQVTYPQPTEAALHLLTTYKQVATDGSVKLQVHLQSKISYWCQQLVLHYKTCSVIKFSSPTFPPIVQVEYALYALRPVNIMIKNTTTFRPVVLWEKAGPVLHMSCTNDLMTCSDCS